MRNTVILGFTIILLLVLIISVIGLRYYRGVDFVLSEIATVTSKKIQLSYKMRDIVRLRFISLQKLMLSNDIFTQDEELQNFSSLAGQFIVARLAMQKMQFNEQERQFLTAILGQAKITQVHSDKLTNYIFSNISDNEKFELDLVQLQKHQYKLAVLLDGMISVQQHYERNAAHDAHQKFERMWMLMLFGFSALLLVGGIVAKKVNTGVRNSNDALIQENEKLAVLHNKALAATQAKTEFLANISHEIRTPLTSILGFSDMLKDEDSDEKDRIDAINAIVFSSNHLRHVINNVLDVSKIEAGQVSLEENKVDPVKVVQEMQSVCLSEAEHKGLQLESEFLYPLPEYFKSDLTRVRQVLLNVLNNAVKFTEQGYVKISTSYNVEKHLLVFVVQDSGIGMKEDDLKKILKPFAQADSSTTRRFGGTGLGLTISSQLLTLMRGHLGITSKVGSGTKVTISFNVVDEDIKLVDGSSKKSDNSRLSPMLNSPLLSGKVLVAEDTLQNQQLFRMYLGKAGISATFVNNGREAVDAALVTPFDVILMDMEMPIMDGVQAISELRERHYEGTIIVVSANEMREHKEKCMHIGADGYLAKPIDVNQLYEQLQKYLQSKTDANSSTSKQARKNQENQVLSVENEFSAIQYQFIEALPKLVREISDHTNLQQWEQLRQRAHQVKGSGSSFGFPVLTELSIKIMAAIKSENTSEVVSLVDDFKSTCHGIVTSEASHSSQVH